MTAPRPSQPDMPTGAGRWPRHLQWAALLAGSVVLIVPLELLGFPAALLLGPMIAAIVLAGADGRVGVPRPVFFTAQAVIGCMMARALPPSIFAELIKDWPIYALGIFSVVAVAAGLGILLARLKVLPGTTAIWGSAPGAASAMVFMSEAFGADSRLVAFMTYLRVALVASLASAVAWVFVPGGIPTPTPDWFPPVDAIPFAETLALIVVSLILARLTRLPAGSVILPMVLGMLLQNFAGLEIELPPVLLGLAFTLVGWSIGLRFTRDILLHAWRALPVVFASIVALIVTCGMFALLLVWLAGVDPLTAYLATSPGGADSVAIIAAGIDVDVPFVMAMQAGRMLVVLTTGPWLARYIATRKWARAL